MGEALGIDLRATACAAARWRGDRVEPCMLGQGTATVVPARLATSPPGQVVDAVEATRALLAAVTDRALASGSDGVAVAVTYALAGDDGPRALTEQAVAAAFGDALVVPRPVAAVARFEHATGATGEVGGHVAVLDLAAAAVEVALVRIAADGYEPAGPARSLPSPGEGADLAAVDDHLDGAVAALRGVIADAGVAPGDVAAVTVVGEPEWLPQLAERARAATGLVVVVDPEPELATAIGAALLAARPGRRGRTGVLAGAAGLLGPALAPHAAAGPATGGLGATVGEALGAGGGAGAGIGSLLGGGPATGDAAGRALGEALAGGGIDRLAGAGKASPGGSTGGTVGGALGRGGHGGALGRALGAATRAGKSRPVVAGLATVVTAVVVIIGAVAAFGGDGGAGGDGDAVETAGGDGATGGGRDPSTKPTPGPGPGGETTTTGPSSTSTPGPSTTAGAPAAPGSPPAPGAPAVPGPGATVPGAPPTTATTAPPDTTGPSIRPSTPSPAAIDEGVGNGFEFCTRPATTVLAATISDPSGVQSATVTWSGGGKSGSLAMTSSGSTWQATLGPLGGLANVAYPDFATISWSVTGVDGAGNSAKLSGPSVTVYGC